MGFYCFLLVGFGSAFNAWLRAQSYGGKNVTFIQVHLLLNKALALRTCYSEHWL